MNKILWAAASLATGIAMTPMAQAALDIGEKAPDFTAPAALAGQKYDFSLSQSLAKGPVGNCVAAQAMRVLLVETDSLDVASVRITFLPAPILWPIGVVLLGLSAMLALSRRPSTD